MQLQDFNTLVEAKAYQSTQKRMISANTMNSLLAQNDLTRAMKKIAETDGHPAQNAMLSFFDPRSTEYNFIQGDPTGDAQIALLGSLIAAGSALDTDVGGVIVPVASKFAQLEPTLLAMCNVPYFPFANATEYQFQVAKGTITYSPIANTPQRLVKLTTTAPVEKHYPRIFERITVDEHQHYREVGRFNAVSDAGTYVAEVKTFTTPLYFEDAYNLV